MAAFVRRNSSPKENTKPISRRRHNHASSARHDSQTRTRRPQSEYHVSWPSLPRSLPHTLSSMTITSHSTPALPLSSPPPPIEAQHYAMSVTMERTPSGNSILSDTPATYQHSHTTHTFSDDQAARQVENHFRRLSSHSQPARIFRSLIERDDPLDDAALRSILVAADSIFFKNVLGDRVRWEWSSQARYVHELIGTTALRRCVDREGFETLIVLSEPILRNPFYDRRLLLSAFLHELIHCYLFIRCGFEARIEGGHTEGFHAIAEIIDNWVGGNYLSLCNMKANLSNFMVHESLHPMSGYEYPRIETLPVRVRDGARGRGYHRHEGCNQSPGPGAHMLDDRNSIPGYYL